MRLLLLASVCLRVALGGPLSDRQADGTGETSVDCATYSSIANLSIISSNSSYRAAFLRSTTDGTLKAARTLNDAQARLPMLINDVILNQQCGNATETALAEAETNFTNGVIAEFKIQPAAGIDPSGSGGAITFCVTIGTALLWAASTLGF